MVNGNGNSDGALRGTQAECTFTNSDHHCLNICSQVNSNLLQNASLNFRYDSQRLWLARKIAITAKTRQGNGAMERHGGMAVINSNSTVTNTEATTHSRHFED
jgi:hypothetical protein